MNHYENPQCNIEVKKIAPMLNIATLSNALSLMIRAYPSACFCDEDNIVINKCNSVDHASSVSFLACINVSTIINLIGSLFECNIKVRKVSPLLTTAVMSDTSKCDCLYEMRSDNIIIQCNSIDYASSIRFLACANTSTIINLIGITFICNIEV